MIHFFPQPYEDELLYSVLARYHIRSGNISPKATMKELFGSNTATAIIDLPSNLDNLIENMPVTARYTAEKLIFNHTLYPFYSIFLPQERAELVLNSMKGNNGGDIHTRAGISASSISSKQYLQFCPKCLNEDREKHGEFYWHRVHQIPGVMVCPKHKVLLQDSKVLVHSQNKHEYIPANEENCRIDECIIPDEGKEVRAITLLKYLNNGVKNKTALKDLDAILEKLWILSNDAQCLLNQKISPKPMDWFYHQYISKLIENGIANINGNVRQEELVDGFISYYGKEFLHIVQSTVNKVDESNWLGMIIRKHRKTFHPIRHLLMIHYLGLTLGEVFYKELDYKPFGESPWPCLNAGAEHYLQQVVKDLKVAYGADVKSPIGTFTCSCGFIYTRRGPDGNEEDRYKLGRIKQFGQVWENKLKKLVNKRLSLNETARQLKVDANTVKKYVKKLELKVYWENRTEYVKENTSDKHTVYKEEYAISLANHRQEWKGLMKQFPEKSKTELRKMNKALYAWLYRNDRDWLNQNSPEIVVIPTINNRVDWNHRDEEILRLVQETVFSMLKSSTKPDRITITQVGKKIGKLALLEKHLNKLPKTKDYLSSVVETMEDFQIRRINWAICELEKESVPVVKSILFRKAGINERYFESIIERIREILIQKGVQ
jgi:hypothetical protein